MKRKIILIAGIVIVICGFALGYMGYRNSVKEGKAGSIYEDVQLEFVKEPLVDTSQALNERIENPIDFKNLTKKYPDVYAWIRIPGTVIDYPIVQREGDNAYYVNHTIDGEQKTEGAIFTEDYNSKDFLDPNTLIYGHNMKNGSMFKGLHKYKDRQFFKENQDVFIYQDGKVLRYKIFAAYLASDTHLLFQYDFEDKVIFQTYLNSVLTKQDIRSNIDTKVTLTAKDRIITLVTCDSNANERYLVQAVLLSIQE